VLLNLGNSQSSADVNPSARWREIVLLCQHRCYICMCFQTLLGKPAGLRDLGSSTSYHSVWARGMRMCWTRQLCCQRHQVCSTLIMPEPFYAQVQTQTSVPAGVVASLSQHRQCLNLWLAQVLGEAIMPPESPAVQHLLMLAALAPQRLGFDPSEASTYRALPAALKVWVSVTISCSDAHAKMVQRRSQSLDPSEAFTYRYVSGISLCQPNTHRTLTCHYHYK